MKRILCFFLLFSLFTVLPTRAFALEPLPPDRLPITAPSAFLMEKSTGQVLYEKNADERMPPASVTKVMTLLLIMEAIEDGTLSLEDTVTASARAASFGGSCVYLEQGEQMSVHEMIKCITVVSANDCAVAMAEHLCGSEELFVEKMNQRAAELGLKNTHFTNCTGLFDDSEHYSCARDIAIMSRELISHELIKDYSTIWMDSIRGGSFELTNTNKLVYWYQGCTGLKTGFTNAAMYCLSATAERDGVEYIAVIMHGSSIESRNADATSLLNYAFANYMLCPLQPSSPLPLLEVEMGQSGHVSLTCSGESGVLVPKSSLQPEYILNVPERVGAPVSAGTQIGTLLVRLGEETIAQVPVCTGEDVPRLGFGGIFALLAGRLLGM